MKTKTYIYAGTVLAILSVIGFLILVSAPVLYDEVRIFYYDLQFKNHEILIAFDLKYDEYDRLDPFVTGDGYIRYGFVTDDYQRVLLYIGSDPHSAEPIMWIECNYEYPITTNIFDYIEKYDCFKDKYP